MKCGGTIGRRDGENKLESDVEHVKGGRKNVRVWRNGRVWRDK